MTRLIEIYHQGGDTMFENWSLRETEINPSHVIKMIEDEQMKTYLQRGYLPKDLNKAQTFTRINLVTGLSTIVVGSLAQVSEKLNPASKQLLHG